jgi:hypothetical protein
MGEANETIPVGVMGLGSIGRLIAGAALSSPELSLVAAIDRAPSLAGRALSQLVPGAPASVTVSCRLEDIAPALKGGVLLHATSSRFDAALPELESAIEAGIHVVSTCEELAFPWLKHPEEADRLDQKAESHGVTVLGTGVNPGFVLDRLVAAAGSVVGKIRKVHAQRVVEVLGRREALQRKVGVGLTEAEFEARVEAGGFGHVGLAESAALCALGLGLDFDELEEEVRPVLAEEEVSGPPRIGQGMVAGLYQQVRGFDEGQEVINLELTIAALVDEAFDHLEIDATPPVRLKVFGGYGGEEATAWAVVNAAARVCRAEPGILTVLELPSGR